MTNNRTYDVIIIGGGMAVLSLALCLAKEGKSVACIDRDDPQVQATAKFDGRTIAVSAGSAEVLKKAGIWEGIKEKACPIRQINITDGGSPTLLEFLSEDIGDESFGHIIENRIVRTALFAAAAKQKNLDHIAPQSVTDFKISDETVTVTLADGKTLCAQLLVGADGRGSWVREQAYIRTRGWEYNQHALICTVQHENPHNNIALEDFRPSGPFAVLPMTDDENGNHRSSIVWTEHTSKRRSAARISEEDFHKKLNDYFPDFYGSVKKISPLQTYPLGLIHAEKYISQRLVLISDAAHGIHPIAGQGLNLGLRDILKLTELLKDAEDCGAPALLEEYQRARRIDNMAMIFATDSLNKLFSNDLLPVRMARRFGLKAVGKLPFAKKFFMKQAMGLRG